MRWIVSDWGSFWFWRWRVEDSTDRRAFADGFPTRAEAQVQADIRNRRGKRAS